MSTLTAPLPTDPKELRPLLHTQVDRIPDGYLSLAGRLLLQAEIEYLADSIGEGADAARAAGTMTPESIQASIAEHRRKHPYK